MIIESDVKGVSCPFCDEKRRLRDLVCKPLHGGGGFRHCSCQVLKFDEEGEAEKDAAADLKKGGDCYRITKSYYETGGHCSVCMEPVHTGQLITMEADALPCFNLAGKPGGWAHVGCILQKDLVDNGGGKTTRRVMSTHSPRGRQ